MSIQRYKITTREPIIEGDYDGEWVGYEDHVEALNESADTYKTLGFLHGMAAMRAACIAAVESIAHITDERWESKAPITVMEYRKHVLDAISKVQA
jgi:hypothetical protein